jgi:cellobiose-specific phosphotransferase system component IIC
LEILDTESVGSNLDKKPSDVPMAYAEQIFMEPISVGTWQMPEAANSYLDDDENKDIVSFVFILLILVFCVVVIFYPFSYYDDDAYFS